MMKTPAVTTTPEAIHYQAVRAPLNQVAGLLQDVLSRRVTVHITGVSDGKTVTRWSSGAITEVRDPAVEQRLRAAYEVTLLLLQSEGPDTVRAWFLGMDPYLDDESPADALRAGRFRDVFAAARSFAAYG
jgi:hypothetical protein